MPNPDPASALVTPAAPSWSPRRARCAVSPPQPLPRPQSQPRPQPQLQPQTQLQPQPRTHPLPQPHPLSQPQTQQQPPLPPPPPPPLQSSLQLSLQPPLQPLPVPALDPARLTLPLHGASQRPAVLGSGAFGVVYAALLDAACPVAIKVLRAPPAHSAAASRQLAVAARQFRREVRRYAALRGVPGVVRFYGAAQCPGAQGDVVHMCVTERMWGGSLAERGEMGAESVLRVGAAAAWGLAEIHRRGFSHGDVKPANVLFEGKGGKGAVKFVDFGLSRSFAKRAPGDGAASVGSATGSEEGVRKEQQQQQEHAVASLIGPPDARGTPAYLSPEAWCGPRALREREVAQKADVYALGMVLYELETGRRPWAGVPEWGIFVAVCNHKERPAWPRDAERVCGLRAVVERCWAQEQARRPTSREVADELGRLQRALEGANEGESPSMHSSPMTVFDTLPLMNYISDFDRSLTPAAVPDKTTWLDSAMSEGAPSTAASSSLMDDSLPDVAPASTTSEAGRTLRTRSVESRDESGSVDASDGHEPEAGSTTVPLTADAQHTHGDPEASQEAHDVGKVIERSRSVGLAGGGGEGDGMMDAIIVSPYTGEDNVAEGLYEEAREEVHEEDQKRRLDTTIAAAWDARNLDYAFKDLVMNDDCRGLRKALSDNARNPKGAMRVLEALGVLLSNHESNCKTFAKSGGTREMSSILSRYGGDDSRLCKAACVCIFRMAQSGSDLVEAELRATGVCEVVLNSMRRHPTNLPVLQSGACAMNSLCRLSPTLCSIMVALGGIDCALRVLARSSNSFIRDVPVASAGLEIVALLAKSHAEAVAEGAAIEKVLECCRIFEDERIDKHCIAILMSVTKLAEGQDKTLSTVGSMNVMAGLILRTRKMVGLQRVSKSVGAPEGTTDILDQVAQRALTFKTCTNIVSGLASFSNQTLVRRSFLSSNVIECVVAGIDYCHRSAQAAINDSSRNEGDVANAGNVGDVVAEGTTTGNQVDFAQHDAIRENTRRREQSQSIEHLRNALRLVAVSGLECLRAMTRLGKDTCGSMQMEEVFVVARDLLQYHPGDRSVASRVISFLESILTERGANGFGTDLDVIYEMLSQLQIQWKEVPGLYSHVNHALRVLRETSDQEEKYGSTEVEAEEKVETGQERMSPLRMFRKRKPSQNRK